MLAGTRAERQTRWLLLTAPLLWAVLALPLSVAGIVAASLAAYDPNRFRFVPLMGLTFIIPTVPLLIFFCAVANRSLGLHDRRRTHWVFGALLHVGVGLIACYTHDLYNRGVQAFGPDVMRTLVGPAETGWLTLRPELERWAADEPDVDLRMFSEIYHRGYFGVLFAAPFSFVCGE